MTAHSRAGKRAAVWTIEWFTPGRFAILLALVIFAANPEVVLGWQTFYYRDFGFFAYPLAHYHRDRFWHGEIPLWNPLNNCGLPFLAQWNTLVLYPGSLFYLLFPLSWSLAVFCLLHQFLAGMGMFCLARRWTGNPLAACVAGAAYAFNGLTLNCLMWPNNIAALGWMPWVILVAQRAWTGGRRHIVAAAAVGAMQMLAGAPEIILLTWIALAVLAASQSLQSLRAAGSVWCRFATVAVLVAGISAAQLFPFLDLLSHAHRDAGYGDSAWAMPAYGWANLLVPMFHCFHGSHGVYWQRDQYWTSSYYPGATIVALALVAVVTVPKRRVRVLTFLMGIALVLALGDSGILFSWLRRLIPQFGFMRYPAKFLALVTFSLPLLAAHAVSCLETLAPPVVSSQEGDLTLPSGAPARLRRWPWAVVAIVWILILGTMMAVVWYARLHLVPDENWTRTLNSGLSRALFLTGTLGGLYVYARFSTQARFAAPSRGTLNSAGTISQPLEGTASRSQSPTPSTLHPSRFTAVAGLALVLFLVLDLLSHAPRQNPVVSRAVFEPGLARFSPYPGHGEGRAMISPANNLKLYRFVTTNAFNDIICKRLCLFANCNLVDAVSKVNGFYSLYLRDSDAVQRFLYDSTNAPPEPLCDFLGVSHITDPENFLEWKQRPRSMPLASAGLKPVFADEITTFKAITSEHFDPRSSVYLPLDAKPLGSAAHGPTPDLSQQGNLANASATGMAGRGFFARELVQTEPERPAKSSAPPRAGLQAKIIAATFTAHRGEIRVEAQEPSWLVIAQNNHHWWRAYSDGAPLRLWRANYAFQGAVVPEGTHVVRLVYRDWGFVAGAVLSLLALASCLATARWRVRSLQ